MSRITTRILQCLALMVVWSLEAAAADRSPVTQREAPPTPESKIVDKWRGTWVVKATRHKPEPVQEVTWNETYDWILDHHYLRSETTRKSDGGQSMSMIWFDARTKAYIFVIYDASGAVAVLPPPTWDDNKQTMEWKPSSLSPINYSGYSTFVNPDTIRWKALLKDWRGTVVLHLEGTSVRRK
jgi:hypothetical protein